MGININKMYTYEDYLSEGTSDYFAAYHIIKRISTPYPKWDIYKLGIIDANGKVNHRLLDSTPTLRGKITFFDRLVMGIKSIFSKHFKSKVLTFALAMKFLSKNLNESSARSIMSMLYPNLNEHLNSLESVEVEANYRILERELQQIMEIK